MMTTMIMKTCQAAAGEVSNRTATNNGWQPPPVRIVILSNETIFMEIVELLDVTIVGGGLD
jgi:hypothetical protein